MPHPRLEERRQVRALYQQRRNQDKKGWDAVDLGRRGSSGGLASLASTMMLPLLGAAALRVLGLLPVVVLQVLSDQRA